MNDSLKPALSVAACSLLGLCPPLAAEPEAAGALVRLTPPVSVRFSPIQGEGKKRKAGMEVTNASDKTIAEVVVDVAFITKDGSVGRSVPHTESWTLGNPKGGLAKGDRKVITIKSVFMEDDTASVDGIVTSVLWKDGTSWPEWSGPAPKKEGDAPVVARFLGIVGEGNTAEPAVAVYNIGTKDISGVGYAISYRDAEGEHLVWDNYGYFGAEDWLPAGKSGGCTGGTSPPPKGAVSVEISLNQVRFADESMWQPKK